MSGVAGARLGASLKKAAETQNKNPSRDKAPGVDTGGFSQRNLNAQSTLRQWAVGVCSLGVARAHGGAQAQSIALLAH